MVVYTTSYSRSVSNNYKLLYEHDMTAFTKRVLLMQYLNYRTQIKRNVLLT